MQLKSLFQIGKNLHNRKPLLWTVMAFVLVVITSTILTVWWNYLLVQNHLVLNQMKAAADNPANAKYPLALFMILGILCSLVILLGLVYLFLRLIRAVQLNLAQTQFIAAVTHELRSPVTGLKIMLETIRNPAIPPEKRKEFELCMKNDLDRLDHLVDQVLGTAKLENLLKGAYTENVQIKSFLENVLKNAYPKFSSSGGSLFVEPINPNLFGRINRSLLETVLNNILDNALKYSPNNKAPDVVVKTRSTTKTLFIEIKDNGIGLNKEEQNRIFKRFYRSTNPLAQSKKGTGLGLYFSKLALAAQGGKISAQSLGEGKGSTFIIELERR